MNRDRSQTKHETLIELAAIDVHSSAREPIAGTEMRQPAL